MREQNIVGDYYRLEPKKRMDYIVYHFESFPAIIRDYEMELEDWILTCRSMARQESLGDLGVRIQSGRSGASPTESIAIERMTVEDIIKSGSLDAYCRSLENADEIQRGLMEIRLMRHEYDRLKVRLGVLKKEERNLLFQYTSREYKAAAISNDLAIAPKSAREKIYRIKKKLLSGFVDRLDSYSDESILLLCSIGEA